MNNFAITQHIPVSNHVYKYLCKVVGGDTYKACRDDYLGTVVLSTLTKSPTDLRVSKRKYDKIFNVIISDHQYSKNGMFVSAKGAQMFNKLIDLKFREEMYMNVVLSKHSNETMYLPKIREFCEYFGITEDDLKYDTIYRDFKRKKDKYTNRIPVG